MKKILIFCLLLSLLVCAATVMAQQAPAPAPASAPATTAAAPAKGKAATFTIARMDLATGVEKREPTGIATTFPASTEKVYCYLELNKVVKGESFTYVWSFGLNEMARVTQTISASVAKYRTWSTKALGGLKGDWKVEIVDEAGNVMKTATFKVE